MFKYCLQFVKGRQNSMDQDKSRLHYDRLQKETELEDGYRKPEQMESDDEFSERRNFCDVKTPLERNLIVIIAILAVIGIGLMIGLANITRGNSRNLISSNCERNQLEKEINVRENSTKSKYVGYNEEICYTASCITEASNLLKSMDLTADPCENFYSFVCGNWIKNAYLSSSMESHFTKIATTIILRVKEILDDLEKETDLPDHKKKVSDFYKGCMDKGHRDMLGARELLSDLDKLGGWPLIKEDWNASAFNWSDLMVELFKKGYVNNMLLSIKVDIDAKNTSRSLISVGNPTLGLGYKIFYELHLEELISPYKEVIFKLAKLFEGDIGEEKSKADIEEAFAVENRLAEISENVEWEHLESFYNIISLEELEKSASMIPWRKLLQDLLPYGTELSDGERIMVTAPYMLAELNAILEELNSSNDGKKSLANYMFYRAVFHASQHLGRNFYLLINNFLDTDKGYVLWEECAKLTMDFFPSSLAASYVTKYMDNTTKHLLEGMLHDLKAALLDDINNSGWLDKGTKQYALYKVRKMRSAIAYRDEIMDDATLNNFYKDINITDDHFSNVKQVVIFMLKKSMEGLHDVRETFRWSTVNNLLTANAYYRLAQNSIIIPVGLLQDTIFAPGRPNYITYGSLGMIVAHELTHAFDSTGCLYDADGNHRMWWSSRSWEKFHERTKCFADQYSNYYVPAANTFVNGELTVGENMADNGGLHTAYEAYVKVLERTGSEKLLPGLPYNARQMFWISFGSVWCTRQTEESIKFAMKLDVHTPAQFRVIGTLSNMEEFSRDFNCKLHSDMHPQSRCSLWK